MTTPVTTAAAASDPGCDSRVQVGRITIEVRGDEAAIIYGGRAGAICVMVPASRLEQWALRILRAEALQG